MTVTDNFTLEWTVEIKEKYRTTVSEDELPQAVQYALSQGFELEDIACGCSNRTLSETGEQVLAAAYRSLADFTADYEEGPTDEIIGDRDVVTFSAVPRIVPVSAPAPKMNDAKEYRSPGFWRNEHSPLL